LDLPLNEAILIKKPSLIFIVKKTVEKKYPIFFFRKFIVD